MGKDTVTEESPLFGRVDVVIDYIDSKTTIIKIEGRELIVGKYYWVDYGLGKGNFKLSSYLSLGDGVGALIFKIEDGTEVCFDFWEMGNGKIKIGPSTLRQVENVLGKVG